MKPLHVLVVACTASVLGFIVGSRLGIKAAEAERLYSSSDDGAIVTTYPEFTEAAIFAILTTMKTNSVPLPVIHKALSEAAYWLGTTNVSTTAIAGKNP